MSILKNSKLTPTDNQGNVKADIDESVYPVLTDVRYELARVESIGNSITYYGEDTFTIMGLRHPNNEVATIDRNVVPLSVGSYITPIYYTSDIKGGQITQIDGVSVLYNTKTEIQDEKLDKGTYRVRIVYEDMRGDDVYSEPIFFDVK